jgi:hypothetical protein
MKKITIITIVCLHAYLQSVPLVTTLVNHAGINIKAQLNFSDHTIDTKSIGVAQSYQIVNFDNKTLASIILTSTDKDKNGNLYERLEQAMKVPVGHDFYTIKLAVVPAHQVAASQATPSFMMPATQKIVCEKFNKDDNEN